jgi:hypothetical protein
MPQDYGQEKEKPGNFLADWELPPALTKKSASETKPWDFRPEAVAAVFFQDFT